MTCREKFEIDHPSLISADTSMNVIGCPNSYGYSDDTNCLMHSNDCDECWSQPVKFSKGDNEK